MEFSLIHSAAFDPPHGQPRLDKAGGTRSKQRARKLQLDDLNWYVTRLYGNCCAPHKMNLADWSLDAILTGLDLFFSIILPSPYPAIDMARPCKCNPI